jgi:hypothetical protein
MHAQFNYIYIALNNYPLMYRSYYEQKKKKKKKQVRLKVC